MVIYVDDGFLVSFDPEVTAVTQRLLDVEWHARDWNVWDDKKTERFLAGDHRFIPEEVDSKGDRVSKVTVSMQTYVKHGVDRYIEDGGKLLPTVPKTPMSTEEEAGAEYDDLVASTSLQPHVAPEEGAGSAGLVPGVPANLVDDVATFLQQYDAIADDWAAHATNEELYLSLIHI